MRIVFFGTPDFAAYSLNSIVSAGFDVVGVVTAPDRPAGRGQKVQASAVKQKALELGLAIAQPEKLKSEEFLAQLNTWNPDLCVVIAFRMLPEVVWNFAPNGTINLHASLLPDYRGAAPIQHAIINGEKRTGLSTFRLVHEIDTGDILLQSEVSIDEQETGGSLHDKLMVQGAQVMVETLNCIQNGSCEPQAQRGETTKVAPKLNREFCRLDPAVDSIEYCERKIRALAPYPGAWLKTQWGDVKLWSGQKPVLGTPLESCGLHVAGKELHLQCTDGYMCIESLQLPGKSRMSVRDFLNGIQAH